MSMNTILLKDGQQSYGGAINDYWEGHSGPGKAFCGPGKVYGLGVSSNAQQYVLAELKIVQALNHFILFPPFCCFVDVLWVILIRDTIFSFLR